MSQHAGTAPRRSAVAGAAFVLLLLLVVMVHLPESNPVKAAMTARYQSLAVATERLGTTQQHQQGRRRCDAASAGPAVGVGPDCEPPPNLMRPVPHSEAATQAAADAKRRDKARAEKEFKDAWARMTPAEKKTTQEEWKKEWERIQAEQRAKAAAAEAKAAKQAAQQPSA